MKVLITPSSFGECGSEPVRLLEEAGLDIEINSTGHRLTTEEVVGLGRDCIGLIAGLERLDALALEKFPHLRVISRLGSGVENVDLVAAERLAIAVRNTPYGPTRAVAELTVGVVLALLRRITQADRNLRHGIWRKEIGQLLQGRVVGVLGLGKIGREVSQLMMALGTRVIAHDVQPDATWAAEHGVRLVAFSDLLSESEILCLHLSISPEARAMVGATELAMMPAGAFLINMARGNAVDEVALFNALNEGPLAGAALDVFSEEPYSGALIQLENVVLTPHLGSYTRDAKLAMEIEAVNNLLDAIGLQSPSI